MHVRVTVALSGATGPGFVTRPQRKRSNDFSITILFFLPLSSFMAGGKNRRDDRYQGVLLVPARAVTSLAIIS